MNTDEMRNAELERMSHASYPCHPVIRGSIFSYLCSSVSICGNSCLLCVPGVSAVN